ncbi:unnamed protein product [Diamesa serratosioi]
MSECETFVNNSGCGMFNKFKLDRDFAEKLRISSPNQYNCLVTMHLSFLLDLNSTDEIEQAHSDKKSAQKKWKGFKKAKTVCTTTKHSPDSPILSDEIIKQLQILIDFLLRQENLEQEGIFRKTGSVARQGELKFLINQLKAFNLDEYTAHDCASVLKSLLADLPEPLLTEIYYPAYSQVADFCNSKENDENSRIKNSLQLLFLLLPKENQIVLENVIHLLHKASKLESLNKMNADTLATLFTPHLICPRKLQPEILHQTATTMTRMISYIIASGTNVFAVPEPLSTDIRAYFAEQKRRRTMTPEKILDESISDSVANTVFTFVDRKKTAEALASNTTDTALAQLYAHIQSMPESTKKKKLIKQFNKQNGQGTPLQFLSRDKNPSSCRSIGDSIKKHIFHKSLIHKTPKRGTPSATATNTPLIQTLPKSRVLFQSPPCIVKSQISIEIKTLDLSSSYSLEGPLAIASASSVTNSNESNEVMAEICKTEEIIVPEKVPKLLINHEVLQHTYLSDDEDFCSSSEEEEDESSLENNEIKKSKSEQNLTYEQDTTIKKSMTLFKNRLLKGVSLGNLKFPFHSPASTNTSAQSPTLFKKSKSSSLLIDIEKDEEKRKLLGDGFDSEESDCFMESKENWNVDISNINYFLNNSQMRDDHQHMRNSMSPITKSTQRMPKSMQESIMTPRSRKPVMLALFGNGDQKHFQSNFPELLEEPEEEREADVQCKSEELENPTESKLRSKSENDISSAINNNGLPDASEMVPTLASSSAPEPLTSNLIMNFHFRNYLFSRCSNGPDDDDSFSSQPNDFDSSNEYETLNESNDTKIEIDEITPEKDAEMDCILNNSNMNDSLLYCLDGNDVSIGSETTKLSRKRQLASNEDVAHVSAKKVQSETQL